MNDTYRLHETILAAQWIENGGPWRPSLEPGMPVAGTDPAHRGNDIVAMIDLQLAIDDYVLACEPSKRKNRAARMAAFRGVYGQDLTYSRTAHILGLSRQTVQRWADSTLIILHHYMNTMNAVENE